MVGLKFECHIAFFVVTPVCIFWRRGGGGEGGTRLVGGLFGTKHIKENIFLHKRILISS